MSARRPPLGVRTLALALALLVLASACGDDPPDDARSASVRVSALATEPTTLVGPDGVTVLIPAGASDTDVTIVLSAPRTRRSTPAGTVAVSEGYRLEPEGKTFLAPLELTIPITPSALPSGKTIDDVVVVRAPQDTGAEAFVPLPTRREGNAVVAQTEHFSDFYAIVIEDGQMPFAGCGDAMCLMDETCSGCPLDCGVCVPQGGDTTPPMVTSLTSPTLTGARGDAVIAFELSEVPLANSVVPATVQLTEGASNVVAGTLTTQGTSVSLLPLSPLRPDTTYTLTVVGLRDGAGNIQTVPYTAVFTTASATPFVSVTPTDGSTDVGQNVPIQLTFGSAIAATTITAIAQDGGCGGSFQVSADGFQTCLGGTISFGTGDASFGFLPRFPLRGLATITARFSNDARDANGFVPTLPAGYDFAVEVDVMPPALVSIDPVPNTMDVSVMPTITMVFSEPIDPASVPGAEVIYDGEGYPASTNTVDVNVVTAIADFELPRGLYYVNVGDFRDFSGNNVYYEGQSLSFHTIQQATVGLDYPTPGTLGVHPSADLQFHFSEAIDEATLVMQATDGPCLGSVQVSWDGGTNCYGGTVTWNGNGYSARTAALPLDTDLLFRVWDDVQTPDGSRLANAQSANFRTSPVNDWGYSILTTGAVAADFVGGNVAGIDAACVAIDGRDRKALIITSTRYPCTVDYCGADVGTPTVASADWVLRSNTAYLKADGTHFFTTHPMAPILYDMTTGSAPISAYEPPGENAFFGGTNWTFGGPTTNCQDYSVTDDSAASTLADLGSDEDTWLTAMSIDCAATYRVLCVEQPPVVPRPTH